MCSLEFWTASCFLPCKFLHLREGNFLKLVEFPAKYDAPLDRHLTHAKSTHYLSQNIQNEFIGLLAEAVLEKIVERVKTAGYYSIMTDCAPDTSVAPGEALPSFEILYVTTDQKVEAYESFFEFIDVQCAKLQVKHLQILCLTG